VTPYAAFQSRNYRFLMAGASVSMLGQQMLGVVVAWDIYHMTRSALDLGNVGLAQVIPVFLFTFLAGCGVVPRGLTSSDRFGEFYRSPDRSGLSRCGARR
jgi:hypothetical protein